MNQTQHVITRMSQRGISQAMVDLTITYGTIINDKYWLGRKGAQARLDELRKEQSDLIKLLDKGGLVVVGKDNTLITAYNCSSKPRQ